MSNLEKGFLQTAIFAAKVNGLIFKRMMTNLVSPTPRFSKNAGEHYSDVISSSESELWKSSTQVIASSESELWNADDNNLNWILTAGKIENLRIASKKFNGLEVKANQIFSFWNHLGNPNLNQGFVVGREIREGCIVPNVGGGLCQLSNALYDAALNAGFEIIERHKHTKVVPGSLAEKDRDATVKWNYKDLRFKAPVDFKMEIEMDHSSFKVVFKTKQKFTSPESKNTHSQKPHSLNDCLSCGNTSCFKHHPVKAHQPPQEPVTAYILDEVWPEYDEFIAKNAKNNDFFILPLKNNFAIKTLRYKWQSAPHRQTQYTQYQGVFRALSIRFATPKQNNVFEKLLQLDAKIARAAAKKIPVNCTHLVVSQNLLPFLYAEGVFGGRTFDVLMTRLPFEKLHQKLDFAHSLHPESATLNDFRVGSDWVNMENKALNAAQKIITPHSEIAEIFKHKCIKLTWKLPAVTAVENRGEAVLFPASAVGRKGAYEFREWLRANPHKVYIAGRKIEAPHFFENLDVHPFDGDFSKIKMVVYPTHVEHQPRLVLKAISMGIPVLTNAACGLEPGDYFQCF
jgi:hypothetical protein